MPGACGGARCEREGGADGMHGLRCRWYVGNFGTAAEPGGGDDPEDDQRGFFSAGWGNGHEDAGIEILDVSFVKVS
jgi:hypothetical protein